MGGHGAVAQLGEHRLCKAGVVGSNPSSSTASVAHIARRSSVFGRLLLAAIVGLVVALLVAYDPAPATAHRPDPAACQAAWEAAPDGEKWPAKQTCLTGQHRHQLAHECSRPRPLVPRTVRVKGVRATSHQRQMLTRALNEARRMRAPRSHLVAVAAGMTQETVAQNLNYGDRDSVGILQLRAMHGTRRWRLVPENSAGWFLRGARQLDPRGRAPLRSDRRTGRWGLIQRVQRSGHPYAYNRWLPESRRTVAAFLGACPR